MTCFNNSQCEAYRAALKDDFVVIQGPPGTGKTYLGLKIVSSLLSYMHKITLKSPIVVVCYTNHALDQFLEGLLKKTEKIIRIGGQCKSEVLAKFNLNKLFRNRYNRGFLDLDAIKRIQHDINMVKRNIDVLNISGILNLPVFFEKLNFNFQTIGEFSSMTSKEFIRWFFPRSMIYIIDEINKINQLQKGTNSETLKGESNLNNEEEEYEELYDEENDIRKASQIDAIEFDDDIASIDEIEPLIITREKLYNFQGFIEAKIFEINRAKQNVDPAQNKMEAEISEQQISKELKRLLHILKETEKFQNFLNDMVHFKETVLDPDEMTYCIMNLFNLNIRQKIQLYLNFVSNVKHKLNCKLLELQSQHSQAMESFKENEMIMQTKFIRMCEPDIVGLTTSGAARYRPLLQSLNPKVVVVEEAAECLEAHVIVSLPNSVEQVILIGDHKQLRPNPATYALAKKWGLDISLFERMIKNGVNLHTLNIQHRMRPEICSLIVPTIYENLMNSESVHNYPPVLGTKKNLFFLDHNIHENKADEFNSHSNVYEAGFIISFCKYLLRQGYSPDQITILTTYSSQLYQLRMLKKRNPTLQEVRITVVDNFQGEENDIILLSLVRSNEEANIGFLSINNRICVALSRAKIGLFIIGNMSNLTTSSETWTAIKEKLIQHGSLGTQLSLYCQIHGKETLVSSAEDFIKVPEGGCDEMCRRLMPCAHFCTSFCHPDDLDHQLFQCHEPCNRSICGYPDHSCPLKCFEKCQPCVILVQKQLKCGHSATMKCNINADEYKCQVIVNDVKPNCGHPLTRPCYKKISSVKCPIPCNIRLDCGHACSKTCHVDDDPDHMEYNCRKDCTQRNAKCKENHQCLRRCYEVCGDCIVPVIFNLPCGHTHKLECSTDLDTFKCNRDCSKELPCTHKCKNKCFETCGPCDVIVKKNIKDCGHSLDIKCSVEPKKEDCKSKRCPVILPCKHKCSLPCRFDCSSRACKVEVPAATTLICTHKASLPCYMVNSDVDPSSDNFLRYCKEPCGALLPCNHICRGTCGECMQGRIHQPCNETCGNILVCGHLCEVPCREDCPPCGKECLFKCEHTKCFKRCGQPCTPCMESCTWECPHKKCRKLCSDICDREPCYEPCLKTIECGHPCVGFCGDPCPPLCRECPKSAEILTAILFGNEEDEDARFVLLEDCNHVIESSGLETWISKSTDKKVEEIGIRVCPLCRTQITKTKRFMNQTKRALQDIVTVRNKIFGNIPNSYELQKELYHQYTSITSHLSSLQLKEDDGMKKLSILVNNYFSYPKNVQKRRNKYYKPLAKSELALVQFLVGSCTFLIETIRRVDQMSIPLYRDKVITRISLLFHHLSQRTKKISMYEKGQFENEFSRLSWIVDFLKSHHNVDITEEMEVIFSISEFTPKVIEKINNLMRKKQPFYQTVTQAERNMIHIAMIRNFSGSKQGHWFKCSNGHIYTITECGGAMARGICPECKEVIGGENHRLISTSRLASEMDNASHPAWSEQNNYGNYNFD